MKILVIAATESEIAPLLTLADPGHVDFLITGAGMVATAFHTGKKLSTAPPYDLIINAGIAGAFDRSIALGTVVNVVEDTFSELGAEDGADWLTIDQLGLGQSLYPANYPREDEMITCLPQCRGITVNTVHGNTESIALLQTRYPDIQVESMEGAAVFYAAQQTRTPVIQIRAISNYVEARNKVSWDIPLAVRELNAWLARFIASKIH